MQSLFEKIPLKFTHLVGWWDGETGIIYCLKRNTLVAIDLATIAALLGEPTQDVHAIKNRDLLVNTDNPLPNMSTISGYAAELNLSQSALLDNFENFKEYITPYITITLAMNGDQALFTKLCDLLEGIQTIQTTDSLQHSGKYLNIIFQQDQNHWKITANSEFTVNQLSFKHLGPILMDLVMTAYYRARPYAYAFHGASLQFKNHNIYLAAPSGKGKSTLSSYLTLNGATLLSDELICFDSSFYPMQTRLPITLKQGSWFLSDEFNELEAFEDTWERTDGRILKYFKTQWRTPKAALPHALFFPSYDVNGDEKIEPIGACTALKYLALSGYEFQQGETQAAITSMLSWLEKIPKYTIQYRSSKTAEKFIAEVLE